MNSVHISAIVKGQGQTVKGGAATRTVVTQDSKGNANEFTIHAGAGDYATKLLEIPSGKRLIIEGRLSNEELVEGSGIYQGVVSLVRTIAVVDASAGADYARAVVSGTTSVDAVRTTGTGTAVANLNVKNVRTFYSKAQNKDVSLTNYINAVAWTEKAKALEPHIPMKDVFAEISGMLVPSEYASTKHEGAMVTKIEVWVDEVFIPGAAPLQTQALAAAPKARPVKASGTGKKTTDDALGF